MVAITCFRFDHVSDGQVEDLDRGLLGREMPAVAGDLAQPGVDRLDQVRAVNDPAQLRIDHAAIRREQHLDGKWLLRTSDPTLTPDDLAAAYKQLIASSSFTKSFTRWGCPTRSSRCDSHRQDTIPH